MVDAEGENFLKYLSGFLFSNSKKTFKMPAEIINRLAFIQALMPHQKLSLNLNIL